MTTATGIGSMPGTDDASYAEAVRVVLGELDLPHVPEMPGRDRAKRPRARTANHARPDAARSIGQ